jgi:hypothetical protein
MHIETQPHSALFIAGFTVNKKISHISEERNLRPLYFSPLHFTKEGMVPSFEIRKPGEGGGGVAALSDN